MVKELYPSLIASDDCLSIIAVHILFSYLTSEEVEVLIHLRGTDR